MMCIICLILVSQNKLKAARPSTCQIRGTSLCTEHGLRMATSGDLLASFQQIMQP
jgi:hypothetical protein